MVARSRVPLRNVTAVDGRATPPTTTCVVDRRFVPETYTSCCAEPSPVTLGSSGPVALNAGGPPDPIVTVADASCVGSAPDCAVTLTLPGETAGAKYSPGFPQGAPRLGQTNPTAAFPPGIEFTSQTIDVLEEPVTLPVN